MMVASPYWILLVVLFWALFLALVGLVIWAATRRSRSEAIDPALDILRERYARGEITADEFRRMRDDLAQRR